MDVEVRRWPAERLAIDDLRSRGLPRLLLIEGDEAPPEPRDCLEDWLRLPASDADLEARRLGVALRADRHAVRPLLDDGGILRFRNRLVGLSPVERELATALVDKYGSVVGRGMLSERAWPDGVPTRNALDVHMLRLRRRVSQVGLEIRTVRSRGYLLQSAN
jgi:DNA-binding response OmpR family regulator